MLAGLLALVTAASIDLDVATASILSDIEEARTLISAGEQNQLLTPVLDSAHRLAGHASLPATCNAAASTFLSSKEFSFIEDAFKDARSSEAHARSKGKVDRPNADGSVCTKDCKTERSRQKRSALHDDPGLSTEQLLTTQDCLYSGIEWLRQAVGVKRVYARCGTLLGAVCWSAMAPWDNDMDVLLGPSDCKLLHAVWEDGERYNAFRGGIYTRGGWDCRRTKLRDGRQNVELCVYNAFHSRSGRKSYWGDDRPWTLKLVPTAEARVKGIGLRRFSGLDIECTVPREHLLKIHGEVHFRGQGFDLYQDSVQMTGIERYVNAIDAGETPPDGLPQPRTVNFGPSFLEIVPRKLVEKHFMFRYGEGWKCYPPGAPWLATVALERGRAMDLVFDSGEGAAVIRSPGGEYADSNHPGARRFIVPHDDASPPAMLRVTGHDGDAASPWEATLVIDNGGSSSDVTIDLSAKGGPAALRGVVRASGDLAWSDGGVWPYLGALPAATLPRGRMGYTDAAVATPLDAMLVALDDAKCGWRPRESLVGPCPGGGLGQTVRGAAMRSAAACGAACCGAATCTSWQWRRDAGCRHGGDVRLGYEKDGPTAWCEFDPPFPWIGERLLERSEGAVVVDRREQACRAEWRSPQKPLRGQCFGLGARRVAMGASTSVEKCRAACCAEAACETWQFRKDKGCFFRDKGVTCRSATSEAEFRPFAGRRKRVAGRTYTPPASEV